MTVASAVSRQLSGIARVVPALSRMSVDVQRRARITYDRALHPLRNAAVRWRLTNGARPKRILVLCYGNVCRSPYLQATLQRDLAGVHVISAGFVGRGRSVPPIALELGRQRGIDLSPHRSTLVTPEIVRDADMVIVMDAELARRVATSFAAAPDKILIAPDLAPTFAKARAIKDPWNQPVEAFTATFDHLDRCVATLVAVFGKTG
ncbi:MAG TPA: hypothetical protein VGN73_12380 [Gemmatimonadaceae bacterium]|nr:hypothetical protein [Gemmatimonadaceae bacterium]